MQSKMEYCLKANKQTPQIACISETFCHEYPMFWLAWAALSKEEVTFTDTCWTFMETEYSGCEHSKVLLKTLLCNMCEECYLCS